MLNICEMDISKLSPWEGNPRLNDQAVEAVASSIRTFGFNVPILVDRDLVIIAGHARWKAASKIGMKTVPIIILELTDMQRRAFALADNKTAEIADWDFPKLRELLEELRSEDYNLSEIGFSNAELVALLTDASEPDWSEFDQNLAALENDGYALLSVKIRPVMKEAIQAALLARATEIRIHDKDKAIMAGKVIQKLLGVEM